MKDIIIIGGGPGGYNLALKASNFALNLLLIESRKVGGTCLNCGCIPTKALYKNASLIKEMEDFKTSGIDANYKIDLSLMKKRKDKIVEDLGKGIEFSLNKKNVEVVYGEAKIVDNSRVEVNGLVYETKNIVIATGSSPVLLPISKINKENVLTSEEMLNLESLPSKLVIIGAGVIGIEMATIFNKFGSDVEVVEKMDRILPNIDSEINKRLLSYLKRSGIKFHLSSSVKEIKASKVIIEERTQEIALEADKILLSIGRKPNIEGLDLDKASINYTNKGIIVDENFETNVKGIFAIGDVTGKTMLAHSATYSGYKVLDYILGTPNKIDLSLTPACIFTFPEIGTIGKTEEECQKEMLEYKVSKALFRANGKANADNDTEGFIKIIHQDDEILGIHIIGPHASDLIHEGVIIMNKKIKISELKDYIFAHPTLSEVLYDALEA